MINRSQPIARSSILVKSFTKRMLEFSENSSFNVKAIQKKLADPDTSFILTFSFLLSILFPLGFASSAFLTNSLLQRIRVDLPSRQNTYLLNSTLII